jgi:hypothetical protein
LPGAAAPSTVRAHHVRRAQAINATGAVFTAVVLVVVFATKVTHGAWIAVLGMLVLFAMMRQINRYYRRVSAEIAVNPGDTQATRPSRVHAIVLVSRLHKPALRAVSLARAIRPDAVTALTLAVDVDDTVRLRQEWEQLGISVPLTVLEAPYRDFIRPLVGYIKQLRVSHPRTLVMVFVPEYVVTRWWQQLLHNQSALRLKARLLFTPGVVIVDVPYQLGVADQGWLGGQAPARTGQPANLKAVTPRVRQPD